VFLRSLLQLVVTTNVVPSSLILFTLMMETIRSSEMPVLKRGTRHHIAENGILHCDLHDRLETYIPNPVQFIINLTIQLYIS
jgi:hypothetical protein